MVEVYTDKDIEFAIRIITERSKLEGEAVKIWLENPDNCHLIDIVAGVRSYFDDSDYEEFRQEIFKLIGKNPRKTKKRILYFSYGIASVLVIGFILSLFFINKDFVLPVSDNFSETEVLASVPYIITPQGKKIELNEENSEVEIKTKGNISTAYKAALQNEEEKEQFDDTLLNLLVAPYGTICHIYLSDGTGVWLNSGSKMKFPTFFKDNKREVYVEGEAYFEVNNIENCPFLVYTSGAKITVKGTSFNIRNYNDEDFFSTSLLTGKVSIDIPEGDKDIVLSPGYELYIKENSKDYIVREVNIEEAVLWIKGTFVFKAMSLESIMKQLQRWYRFEVVYGEEKIKEYKFRGVLEREMPLEQILDIICELTYLDYQIENKKVILYKK